MLLCLFITESKAQCLTMNTIPNFNCVTSVCEITITITNAATPPPYTVTSSPAGISGVITGSVLTLTNIPFQSTYNIFLSSAGTCSAFGQVLYTNPTLPVNISITQTNVSCYGGNDASVYAAFAGAPPYTWKWSNGSTSPTTSGLTAGTYSVTMTNSDGCEATRSFIITQPSEIISRLTATLIPCFGTTLSTVITTSGGVAPFNYTVNGVPVTTSPGNLAAGLSTGVQTLMTKDAKGCIRTNTIFLNQAAQQIITSTVTVPSCPGRGNGAIHVSVSGPVAGYTYSWNPVTTVTSANLLNITAGNYTLSVLDASNCMTQSVITVPEAPAIIPVPVIAKENCSAADGAFTLNVSGGAPPFTYTTIPGNATGNSVTGLSTGSYTTFIKDTKGCIDSTVTHVGNLSTVTLDMITLSTVPCYSVCSGSVMLDVKNAVPPVNYSITGLPLTTNTLVSNLCSGLYVVKATDAIGCPAFDTIVFPQLPVFGYSVAVPPVICIGQSAQLEANAYGGSGQLSYIWNPGALTGQTIAVSPQVSTVYSLNVYDSKGCTLPGYTVNVRVNPPITVDISTANAGICPGTTAQITPTVTGGDGNYSYLWQPGSSSEPSVFVENITVPVYTVEVTDACGSPKTVRQIEIKLHPVIQPTYITQGTGSCAPYCLTFINATPNSKNAVWNYGDKPFEQPGDTTLYCYEKPGNFNLRLTVTDSNNCKAGYTYLNAINVLTRPSAAFITEPDIITLNNADRVLLKNTSNYAHVSGWYVDEVYQGAQTDVHYSFKDTGCYDIKLVVTNSNQCTDSTIRSICVFEGFNFYMPSAFSPNNDGLNDILLPKGTGWLHEDYLFEVYNRWGQKVFSTNDVQQGWDGGAELDPARIELHSANMNIIYTWRVLVRDNRKEPHELRGFVTLLR